MKIGDCGNGLCFVLLLHPRYNQGPPSNHRAVIIYGVRERRSAVTIAGLYVQSLGEFEDTKGVETLKVPKDLRKAFLSSSKGTHWPAHEMILR
jgi:hypothetical protein